MYKYFGLFCYVQKQVPNLNMVIVSYCIAHCIYDNSILLYFIIKIYKFYFS